MDFLWESITGWLKEVLVSGIMSNLSGLFDTMNDKVSDIAGQVGTTPQAWNSGIFNMVHSLSETVILPVAGVILAFVMTLELVQLLLDKNNYHEIESAVIQVNDTEKFKRAVLNQGLTSFLQLGENNLTNGLSLPFPILNRCI